MRRNPDKVKEERSSGQGCSLVRCFLYNKSKYSDLLVFWRWDARKGKAQADTAVLDVNALEAV